MKHQQSASDTPLKGASRKPLRATPAGSARPRGPGADFGRDEMIRQAAYAYYEARGCIDGHDLEDWLRAEAQVSQAPATGAALGQAPSH